MGFPEPLNTRPSISSETGIFKVLPVNSTRVFLASMPEVPSKTFYNNHSVSFSDRPSNDRDHAWLTWTTAFFPWTSSTWPARLLPSGKVSSTISENLGYYKCWVMISVSGKRFHLLQRTSIFHDSGGEISTICIAELQWWYPHLQAVLLNLYKIHALTLSKITRGPFTPDTVL